MPLTRRTSAESLLSRAEGYCKGALEGALADAARAGQRNDALNRAAYRIGGLVWRGFLTEDDARLRLLAIAEGNGLIEDDGEKACIATINSGLRDGTKPGNFDLPMNLKIEMMADGLDPDTAELSLGSPIDPAILESARESAEARRQSERREHDSLIREWESGFLIHRFHEGLVNGPDEPIDELLRRRISPLLWGRQGFHLGWAEDVTRGRSGIVIPWIRGGGIQTIQVRFIDGRKPKYNWWPGMLGGTIFHADALLDPVGDDLLVVEGAFNTMRMMSLGFPAVVGLPTVGGFSGKYASWFRRYKRIYVLLDSGAAASAEKFALAMPEARFVILPSDPDDYSCSFASDGEARRAIIAAMRDSLPL